MLLRITTLKGLVTVLTHELERLGYKAEETTINSVAVKGELNDAIWLNLNLRTAFHILYPLAQFPCNNPEDLYRAASGVPWEEWLRPEIPFCVTSTVVHDTIRDSRFPNLRVKDAIADRMRKKTGQRPNSGPDDSGAVVRLYWKGNEAALYIDTSGEPLSRRGYRKNPFKAPLQEPLAAAILLASSWNPTLPLVNPMGGSGTIGIEAALISLNKAPGLIREYYGFMALRCADESVYQDSIERLKKAVLPELRAPIIITDFDRDAIAAARTNAKLAGVDGQVGFSVCDFADSPISETPGCLFLNPGYAMRMGEEDELRVLYKRIGDFFKQKCPGWTGYVFSGNPELLKSVGLAPKRRIPFYNAKIDCRLHEFVLYAGSKKVNQLVREEEPVGTKNSDQLY